MKRYDSYKDSGVKWIGEIPNHWKLMTNKYFTKSQKNKSEFGDEVLLSVSEYQGVIPRRNIREGEEHLSRSESLVGYLKVRKGELVSNIMLMWKRGLGVSEYEGIVSPSYSVFSFKKSEPKYFHYLYRTDQYVSEFRRNSTGVIESRLRLYDDSFGSLKSHFPPLSEQQQIVSFLDTKTSLIDSLIEKTQRKIELLKEKRTSLINEVVTKGLNPNVEMKDSGVEWIGEIPSHWFCVGTNKVYHDLGTGTTPTSDNSEYYSDNGYHWITTTDLNEGIMYDTLSKITEKSVEDYPNLRLYPSGSIYISMYGGRIGKLGVSTFDSYCNQSVCVLPKNDTIIVKFYYYWFLGFQEFVKGMGRGGGQPNINKDMIKSFPTVKIPLSEQQQIVDYLDEQTQLIDNTISIEEKRIELLKEYRQSLISEVVTGKLKVTTDE